MISFLDFLLDPISYWSHEVERRLGSTSFPCGLAAYPTRCSYRQTATVQKIEWDSTYSYVGSTKDGGVLSVWQGGREGPESIRSSATM